MSPQFCRWWADRHVACRKFRTKTIRHPELCLLVREQGARTRLIHRERSACVTGVFGTVAGTPHLTLLATGMRLARTFAQAPLRAAALVP